MVWGEEDSVGLVSTILGTCWFYIIAWTPIFYRSPSLGFFFGGFMIQALGIYAIVNDSKLGIGGFALGTLYFLLGFIYLMPSRIMML